MTPKQNSLKMNIDTSIELSKYIQAGDLQKVIEFYKQYFNLDEHLSKCYEKYIFIYSIEKNKQNIFNWITKISHSIDINTWQHGFTICCCEGSINMAMALIDKYPDFTCLRYNNCEPIRLASYHNNFQFVDWLLDIDPYICGV